MNQFENQFLKPDAKIASWQNLQKSIEEMEAASPYRREKETERTEKINPKDSENPKFAEIGELKIEHIKDRESPKIDKIVEFMEKFAPEEADTPEIIRDAVANPTDAYAYHTIENQKGETISHAQSSYLELTDENDQPLNQSIIFGGFVITADEYRRKRLADEIWQSALRCNLEKAQKKNQELKAIVVEGKEESEPFWNHVGLKRVYFEDAQGNLHETPYIQPPIDWNNRTGLPKGYKKGDDMKKFSVPEHLMIKPTDNRNEITTQELMPIISAIYSDNYTLYRNEGEKYPTDKAIESTQEIVGQFQTELKQTLSQAKEGKLYLLDAKEREQKMMEFKAAGKNFEHFMFSEKENGE